jgi:hypothetical protein
MELPMYIQLSEKKIRAASTHCTQPFDSQTFNNRGLLDAFRIISILYQARVSIVSIDGLEAFTPYAKIISGLLKKIYAQFIPKAIIF